MLTPNIVIYKSCRLYVENVKELSNTIFGRTTFPRSSWRIAEIYTSIKQQIDIKTTGIPQQCITTIYAWQGSVHNYLLFSNQYNFLNSIQLSCSFCPFHIFIK